jgi:hypothetical protein
MHALRLEIRGFCPQWVIHVIPAIPACPVHPKSGHSANLRVYEYTAYGAAHPRRAPRC